MSHPPYIAVVGAGEDREGPCRAAEAVGRALAEAGAVLVCGGLGGVMEAACRGARSAGGTTVGILPSTNRDHANRYVDVALPTGMGETRNALIIRAADAVIAIDGEYGTLSEIGFALKVGVPVIGIDTWELSRDGQRDSTIVRVESPEEAVNAALERSQR